MLDGQNTGTFFECKPGAARAPLLGSTYQRRQPETTVLYQLVADELATFREHIYELFEAGLPRFILKAFERYLACGILSEGFARLWCPTCKEDHLVGFFCKTRGLCPSL